LFIVAICGSQGFSVFVLGRIAYSFYFPMSGYRSIVLINDCRDDATASRQITRTHALTGIHPSFVGIGDFADLEGAGCIVDALDALTGSPGIIIANAAPRHGKKGREYPNGTPFAFFRVDKSLVISSVQGQMLSLIKKLGLTQEYYLTDIPEVTSAMIQRGYLGHDVAAYICQSQFRSFDYLPRLAAWLMQGVSIPHQPRPISDIADVGAVVWLVDNFGNCKTTILPEEINFAHGQKIETKYGVATMYRQLRDVPDGELALIIGSSGYRDKRFVELVIQGESVATKYHLSVGSAVLGV
jgi:hypothetical protein